MIFKAHDSHRALYAYMHIYTCVYTDWASLASEPNSDLPPVFTICSSVSVNNKTSELEQDFWQHVKEREWRDIRQHHRLLGVRES